MECISELKESLAKGFTKKYLVHHLVYDEIHTDVYEAITREKRIQKWNRQWKTLLSKTILSGLILPSDYFEGWLPACAGMTGFFIIYRALCVEHNRKLNSAHNARNVENGGSKSSENIPCVTYTTPSR